MWKGSFPHRTLHFSKRVTGKHFSPACIIIYDALLPKRHRLREGSVECMWRLTTHMRPVTIIQTDNSTTSFSLHTSPCIPEQRQFKTNKQLVWIMGKEDETAWKAISQKTSNEASGYFPFWQHSFAACPRKHSLLRHRFLTHKLPWELWSISLLMRVLPFGMQ